MYKYETHLHTFPVSRCATAGVEESVKYYKSLGYDGVFITNHFLDGNLNFDKTKPYEEQIEFYFSDYEKAVEIGKEIGLKVFLGQELSDHGTDFLIYGLDKQWYLDHPEIMQMKKKDELALMREHGALVIQAHPFRLLWVIQLMPVSVDGIEVVNASRTDKENNMAKIYAMNYGFLESAGSDNHIGPKKKNLAGICTKEPIESVEDFIYKFKNKQTEIFTTFLHTNK